MAMLDYGRDKTDVIVREVGNDLWDKARAAAPALLARAILDQANANSVDPGYVRWVLMNDRRSWSRLPKAGMLDAAYRLYVESASREHGSTKFTVPSDMAAEQRVNKALQGLVKWAGGQFADPMAKIFIGLATPAVDKIKAAVLEESGERISSKQARRIIMVELPLRVKDHPHWFRDSATLQLLLQGLLG